MQTVVELPSFIRKAESLMSRDEVARLITFLAQNPDAGDVMTGTGGFRKLRWALQGRGKSGGARVVYFYHNEHLPLFLTHLYAKNEKGNLTKAERNDLAKAATLFVTRYGREIS